MGKKEWSSYFWSLTVLLSSYPIQKDQVNFCPSALWEVSVLPEFALGQGVALVCTFLRQ